MANCFENFVTNVFDRNLYLQLANVPWLIDGNLRYVVYVFMRDIFDVIKLMVNDVSLCSVYHATANDVNEGSPLG